MFLCYQVCVCVVPHISTPSSNKQRRAKSPLSSTWKEKSAPRARHEKKPIQNRPVHKSLAHVDRGRRLLGAEQQRSRQTDRQADRRHAHPDCLWWKAPLWWGARHTETKACKPRNNALPRPTVTERKHNNLTERKAYCICTLFNELLPISALFAQSESQAGARVKLHPLLTIFKVCCLQEIWLLRQRYMKSVQGLQSYVRIISRITPSSGDKWDSFF